MDDILITTILNLGVAGIFIMLYMRLWTLYINLLEKYLQDLRDVINKAPTDDDDTKEA